MKKLQGKVAVVTGGASGIGRGIAEAMQAQGARLVVCDRNAAAVEEAARALGKDVLAVALDVTDNEAVIRRVSEILGEFKKIDILVNSAGVYGFQPWSHLTAADFHRIFDVNVYGLAMVTQQVAPAMASQGGGSIINIASVAGRQGNPMSVFYAASKAAVISLTQSAAQAFAASSVRVNAIAPGRVATPMWDEVLAMRTKITGEQVDELRERLARSVPLGRMSTAEDYQGPALFLAGDDSRYMTGQTINVDGGLVFN